MRMVRWLWALTTSIPALVIELLGGGVALGIASQLAHGASWLLVPAAAAVSAGLTIIVSKRTTEVVASETYRKDAILTYKDKLYEPLHTELKYGCVRLQMARAQREAYPQHIATTRSTDVSRLVPPPTDPATVHFQLWPLFRADFTIKRFNPAGQQLLDAALEAAEAYNAAVEETKPPAEEMLTVHLADAIDRTRQSSDFQQWRRDQPEWVLRREQSTWHTFVDSHRASGELEPAGEMASGFAKAWLYGAVLGRYPSTLGWLLAGSSDRAADAIHDAYIRVSHEQSYFPVDWLQVVLRDTWTTFQASPEYAAFQAAEQAFFDALHVAEKHLADGLLTIRDRYEGAEPLV